MKTTLINPHSMEFIPKGSLNNCFPLGLAYVAGALLKSGKKFDLIDLNTETLESSKFDEKIIEIDVVGITTMIGGSLHNALDLIELVKKKNRKAIIVVGGAIASASPKQFLQETMADIVVVGEGEETFVTLLDYIECGKDYSSLPGIATRRDNQIIVNEVGTNYINLNDWSPAYQLFKIHDYFHKPVINIGERPFIGFTSRGCPFFCKFCRPNLGRQFRSKSVDRILEELLFLKETYGADGIQFYDDNFTHNRQRIIDLCNGMIEKMLNFKWVCEGRASSIDKELVEKMREAGCVAIFMGIESGSNKVLKSMKKGANREIVYKASRVIRDAKIPFWGNFIVGMPEETRQDVWATISLIYNLLKIDSNISAGFFVPRPNTEWFDFAVKMGMPIPTLRDWADYNRCYKFEINLSKMYRFEVKLYYYLITFMSLFNKRGLRRIKRVFEITKPKLLKGKGRNKLLLNTKPGNS